MSEAMKLLQGKCGITTDGSFGPNTARAITAHYKLTPERAAHLLGQASHESGGFKLTKENLNYSAEVMCRVWPSRFKSVEDAAPYARNPKALAYFLAKWIILDKPDCSLMSDCLMSPLITTLQFLPILVRNILISGMVVF
jgi:hypothetical protein